MIRALAFCAVISVIGVASAQTVTTPIIADQASGSEPTIALPDGAPISACGKQECPAPSGETTSEKPIDDHALLRQKLAEMNCLQSEIESLRVATGTPQQIVVKVIALEVSRTKMRKLGIDFSSIRGEQPNKQAYSPPDAQKGGSVEFATIDDTKTLFGLIKHLEENNIARVLTDTDLAVTCGQPASFNVGGEVPMRTLPGANQAVEFKPFGTQVDVLAVAQGDNRVLLDIGARVSELDHGHDLQIGNVRVPGLQVRQMKTGFTLKFGQTGVMSGLTQRRVEVIKRGNTVEEVVNDIELLFLVTPEHVAAANGLAAREAAVSAAPYRTANSAAEANPAERSLRVSKPYTPR